MPVRRTSAGMVLKWDFHLCHPLTNPCRNVEPCHTHTTLSAARTAREGPAFWGHCEPRGGGSGGHGGEAFKRRRKPDRSRDDPRAARPRPSDGGYRCSFSISFLVFCSRASLPFSVL